MPAKAGTQFIYENILCLYNDKQKEWNACTGMTNDLVRRVYEHRSGTAEGFTKKYGLKMLVWYEHHVDVNEAIKREKNIQAWKREWKMNLIQSVNLEWRDLYNEVTGCQPSLA